MTEKLYYADSGRFSFDARVLECREGKGRWEIILDRSAFFPEGGGQGGDAGTLGGVRVTDTHEREGIIVHRCDGPLSVGAVVEGRVDAALRFARMQIHSGEHIVSGTAHREWGCENVGFHMTENGAVIDFDRELDEEQLDRLEFLANEAVWRDLPVRTLFPSPEELSGLSFRQKKELSGEIRLVEIPGVDLCACCAPHVKSTGCVGQIRFTSAMRHRGGVRLTMTAGRAALSDARMLHANAEAVSRLFSAPREETAAAAERFAAQKNELEQRCAVLEKKYTSLRAASFPGGERDLLCFEDSSASSAALRDLAEALSEKCPGIAGAFAGEGSQWRYVLASKTADLRAYGKSFNASLRGRGGGSPSMIQGSVNASRKEIEELVYGKER
jgi:alanyl-tRNA synthetase